MVEGNSLVEGDYDEAFKFTISWEGWECTEDGHRTMGGISQDAYDSWLTSQGFKSTDVCITLTKGLRKRLLHDDYWVASGADSLKWPLSAAHFDTAVGSGAGRARKFLKNCSTFECYQQERIKFYEEMRSYSEAWVKRTHDLEKFIQTGKLTK